jgi:hypothetical protein
VVVLQCAQQRTEADHEGGRRSSVDSCSWDRRLHESEYQPASRRGVLLERLCREPDTNGADCKCWRCLSTSAFQTPVLAFSMRSGLAHHQWSLNSRHSPPAATHKLRDSYRNRRAAASKHISASAVGLSAYGSTNTSWQRRLRTAKLGAPFGRSSLRSRWLFVRGLQYRNTT